VSDGLVDVESAKSEIAREIARVHQESYGEAAHNLEVSIEPGFVAVVMEIDLSPAERTLIGAGNAESVKISREAFQLAIAPTFRAIVERATGRTVASFASRTVLDTGTPWSAEIFRLGPAA
jgi:uncharacterized protein YbcI